MSTIRGPWKKPPAASGPLTPPLMAPLPRLPHRPPETLEAEEDFRRFSQPVGQDRWIRIHFDVSPGLWWLLIAAVLFLIWVKA